MPGMAMKRDLTPQQLRAREMMKHVHPAYDRASVDFDRIAIGTGILCVECKACGKRAALTKENCTHIHPGNKTEVRSVTFRCSRIDCGSTDVRRYGGMRPRGSQDVACRRSDGPGPRDPDPDEVGTRRLVTAKSESRRQ